MLENLTQRLSRVVKTIRGEARLTEDNIAEALREVRVALLEADVALPVVKDFIGRVREKALGQDVVGSLTPGQALVGVVNRELAALMGGENAGLNLAVTPPAVILMAGLQGSGKTTTAAKLAKLLLEQHRKKPLLVSADVYRPAAIEQLKTVAAQVGADFYPSAVGEKPVDIALAALDHARKHYNDVLIVDTAGRLAIDEKMMQEIKELSAALSPAETLFVVDAMQGQDAVNVARAFDDAIPLTGVVLTKLDGDARGGAALSVRHVTGKPIKLAGTSEKLGGLEPFHPDRMAARILGMGDVLSLVEEAHKSIDLDEAMMAEIKALHAAITPIETLFVVDSMTGQDAANTAKAFAEALPLTGVVLTKTDGDARGGAALSVRYVTGRPIKFLGAGEKTDALEPFYPDRVAQRILGMGDVLSLVEEVERKVDQEKAQKLATKVMKGKRFDLNDMRDQLEQMNNMGGLAGLMDKLPGVSSLPDNVKSKVNDGEIKRMIAIIGSMTKKE
ncbi:MAG TPA: signal recognition particle receptor subunit alpha, partial [Burkholderiales bacterium]|nr:signal recognition particle receptor subunit alpha [Burkholderiales bacterium]